MPVTPYSESELQNLLREPESDLVERKRSLEGDANEGIRRTICAFANDLPGKKRPGVIFLGLSDDGSFSGLEVNDDLVRRLTEFGRDGTILPPPLISVERLSSGGHSLAAIVVFPSDSPPSWCRGKIWVRIGSTTRAAQLHEEKILNERRSVLHQRFDSRPVSGAKLPDLDLRRFEGDYLPHAVDQEALEANDRTVEQRLAALKMIASPDNPVPTGMGILVLGRDPLTFIPGAYVQFLRLDGSDLSDPVLDEARCDGTIMEVVNRIDEKMKANIQTGVEFRDRPVEVRNPTYPFGALQQLVRNAVMHRDYENTNTPIRVHWFTDRVEVISPGGPFGVVTVDNFGEPGRTDYRNAALAEAMRVLGLVQRFGAGIPLIRRELRENGNPEPEFQVEPNWVHCTVKAGR